MTLTLGLCIPSGKKSRMKLPDRIRELCKREGINIIDIDINKPIESQGPFDILLHKVLDFHNEFSFDDAERKISYVMKYAAVHPNMVVLDNFQWSLKLTDRKFMYDLIKSCQFNLSAIKVFCPKTIEINKDMSITAIYNIINKNGVRFPVLIKPYSAYFADGSHDMALVFSLKDLCEFKPPFLVQEFCNHSGVLYKVFVVGDKFNICERPSIKDTKLLNSKSIIRFDSHKVSKTGIPYIQEIHSQDPNNVHWHSCDEKPNMLDKEVIRELICRMQKITGLFLLGIDVLVENETKNYAIIDVNQFPSYKGIGDLYFPSHLVSLIKYFK